MAIADIQLMERSDNGKRALVWMRLTAIACALMLVFASTLQVAHSHADERASDHCQICLAIHSAMPARAVAAQVIFTSTLEFVASPVASVPPRFWISPFANGPPALKLA